MQVKGNIKNQNGFTLIELMIVVAIIGILAAIAIPQFENFVNKSKRSEAVVTLSAVNKAEIAYYAQADHFLVPPQTTSYINQALGITQGGATLTQKFEYEFTYYDGDGDFLGGPETGFGLTLLSHEIDKKDLFPDGLFIKRNTTIFAAKDDGVPYVYADDITNKILVSF